MEPLPRLLVCHRLHSSAVRVSSWHQFVLGVNLPFMHPHYFTYTLPFSLYSSLLCAPAHCLNALSLNPFCSAFSALSVRFYLLSLSSHSVLATGMLSSNSLQLLPFLILPTLFPVLPIFPSPPQIFKAMQAVDPCLFPHSSMRHTGHIPEEKCCGKVGLSEVWTLS